MRLLALRRVAPRQSSSGFFHPDTTYRIQRAGWLHRVTLVSPGSCRCRPLPLARRMIDPDFSASNRRVRIQSEVSTRRVSASSVGFVRRVLSPRRQWMQLVARTLEPVATARRPSLLLRAVPFTVASDAVGFPAPPRHHRPTAFQPRRPCRPDRPEGATGGASPEGETWKCIPRDTSRCALTSPNSSISEETFDSARTVIQNVDPASFPAAMPLTELPGGNLGGGRRRRPTRSLFRCAMHLPCKCYRFSTRTISPYRSASFRNTISRWHPADSAKTSPSAPNV